MRMHTPNFYHVALGAIRLSDPNPDSQKISVQIHLANEMTLDQCAESDSLRIQIHCGYWSDNRIRP